MKSRYKVQFNCWTTVTSLLFITSPNEVNFVGYSEQNQRMSIEMRGMILNTDIPGIDQASLFHLILISLYHSPSLHSFQFLFY